MADLPIYYSVGIPIGYVASSKGIGVLVYIGKLFSFEIILIAFEIMLQSGIGDIAFLCRNRNIIIMRNNTKLLSLGIALTLCTGVLQAQDSWQSKLLKMKR